MKPVSVLNILWTLFRMESSVPTYRTSFTGTCGKVAAMIFFIVATCLFLACTHDEDKSSAEIPDANLANSRTVMVYMVGENSLGDPELKQDVREMIKGRNGLNFHAGDHLVLYVDDNALPRIYELKKNLSASHLTDLTPVYTYKEDVNSASADQLGDFIRYVKRHYPAQSYGLLMWSHASGWIPSTYEGDKTSGSSAKRRSFGLDNQKNSYINIGFQMEIKDMAAAIEAEGGVDFMFFDACSMQTIEVAYALRNATECIIASPAEIPGPGADYATMVPAMFQKEDPVQQMLSAYYNAYLYNRLYGVVISAVKTEALEDFAAEMRGIVQRYKSQLMDLDKQPLLNYFVYGTWGTASPDCLDMQAVMQTVLPENEYGPWKEKLDAFVSCQATDYWYSACVPDGFGGHGSRVYVIPSQCSGISMAIPFEVYSKNAARYDLSYLETAWAQAVWNAVADGESGNLK